MTLISITDALTNETITREMTAEELAQREKDNSEQLAIATKHKAEADKKAAARQSVYDKLGLSADDVAALFE